MGGDAAIHGLVMTAEALRAWLGSVVAVALTGLVLLPEPAFILLGDLASVVNGRTFALNRRELAGRPKDRRDRAALAGLSYGETGDLGDAAAARTCRLGLVGLLGPLGESSDSYCSCRQ